MTDYNQFQVGGVVQPLSTSSTNSLLRDADPALFYALDFWTYVINTYPGPRLVAAAAAAGFSWPAAVLQAYPYEPLAEYLENQIAFPALFAYRKDLRTEWHSVGYEHDITTLELYYVLPPLDAAASERLLPIFNAVSQALRRKTTDAWDPGYTPPGGVAGQQFDSAAFGGVEEIGFGEYLGNTRNVSRMGAVGYLENAGGLYFPCLHMTGYVVERDTYNPTSGGPSKFAGADITGNLKADDGTRIAPFVQQSTQQAPTVTALSVVTGPIAGGTVVTITGTLFLAGPPAVYFGPASAPQYAASVTYTSATSLTVTTPAMSGAGAVDVTVVNRDGQSGTLAGAFTFT